MKRYVAMLLLAIAILGGATPCEAAFPVAHTLQMPAAPAAPADVPSATVVPRTTPDVVNKTKRWHKARRRSQPWAIVLCCVFGIVGAHRYYLGYTLEGIIQTLTLGGGGVWWLIDLVRICTGDLQPKEWPYTNF